MHYVCRRLRGSNLVVAGERRNSMDWLMSFGGCAAIVTELTVSGLAFNVLVTLTLLRQRKKATGVKEFPTLLVRQVKSYPFRFVTIDQFKKK